MTTKLCLSAMNASLGGFLFGYNMLIFNPCQQNIAHSLNWGDLTTLMISLITGIHLIGAFIGCLLSGKLSTHKGCRVTMMVADLIGLIGCMLCVYPSTLSFASGRLLSGICIGMLSTIAPLYISQNSPPDLSGRLGTLFRLQVCTGMTFSSLLSLRLPEEEGGKYNDWWIVMFTLQAPVILLQLFNFTFIFNSEIEYQVIEDKEEPETPVSEGQKDSWTLLKVGILLFCSSTLCGIELIDAYSTELLKMYGFNTHLSRIFTLSLQLVEYLGIVTVFILVHRVGRKTLIVRGLFGMTLLLLAVSLTLLYIHSKEVAIAFTILYKFTFTASLGTVLYIYTAETLNSNQLGIANAFEMLISIAYVMSALYLLDYFGAPISILMFAAFSCLLSVFFFTELKETKGLTREEIGFLYSKYRQMRLFFIFYNSFVHSNHI